MPTNAQLGAAPVVRLAKRPPWNRELRTPVRGAWYALVGGRRFVVESLDARGLWSIWEVDEAGRVADVDQDFVALTFTLGHARLAVQMRVDGKNEAAISDALRDAPRPGTGRNHPRHVERRRRW